MLYTGLCTICIFVLAKKFFRKTGGGGAFYRGATSTGADVRGACVHGGHLSGSNSLGEGGGGGYQEGSPQGRFATGRFVTKLESSPQLWKARHKCRKKVRHNVRMHYKTVKIKLYFNFEKLVIIILDL